MSGGGIKSWNFKLPTDDGVCCMCLPTLPLGPPLRTPPAGRSGHLAMFCPAAPRAGQRRVFALCGGRRGGGDARAMWPGEAAPLVPADRAAAFTSGLGGWERRQVVRGRRATFPTVWDGTTSSFSADSVLSGAIQCFRAVAAKFRAPFLLPLDANLLCTVCFVDFLCVGATLDH